MNFTGTAAKLTHPFTGTQLIQGEETLLEAALQELPPQMAANCPHHHPQGPQPTRSWVKQQERPVMRDRE